MSRIRADEWATLPVVTGFHWPSSGSLFILVPLVNPWSKCCPPASPAHFFFPVSISAHQKKGERMSETRRVITAQKWEGFVMWKTPRWTQVYRQGG